LLACNARPENPERKSAGVRELIRVGCVRERSVFERLGPHVGNPLQLSDEQRNSGRIRRALNIGASFRRRSNSVRNETMNEIVKHSTEITPTTYDGYDYQDSEPSTGGADYAKFDGAAQNIWHGRDGAGLSLGPYIAVNCQIELLRWNDKKVVDRIVQKPGDPLPDPDYLNAKIPQSEWEEDFSGNPKGPWQKNYTNFLVDPKTGAKFIVSNSTVGQRIAFENLKERVGFMRRLRGHVYPLVMLSSKSMRTKFGMKMRPDFEIIDWRT
jgi:hypothetical protein